MKLPQIIGRVGFTAGMLAALTLLSGCRGGLFGSQPYREVGYYALRTPTPQPCDGYDLEIVSFRMLAAGRNKMVYRDASCRVLIDDYNKWLQSPSFMVRQYLQTYFAPSDAVRSAATPLQLRLRGTVVAFEIDLKAQEVVLGVEYTISRQDNSNDQYQASRLIREKYDAQSPEEFAEAMSRAVARLVKYIAGDVQLLKKQIAQKAVTPVTPAAPVTEKAK